MIKHFLKFCITLLLALLLVGCDSHVECIEADDWGQQVHYNISGRNNEKFVEQPDHTQIGQWNSSGLVLDGNNIVAVVKNSQTVQSNRSCDAKAGKCSNARGGYCPKNTWVAWFNSWSGEYPVCTYKDNYWCPTSVSANGDVPVNEIPCLFNRGIGLFAVISESYKVAPDMIDPFNGSHVCSQDNISECYLHVGEQAKNPPFYDNYCPAAGFMLEPPNKCASGEYQCGINFKILDRYYLDNTGNYKVVFKQGVKHKSHGVISKFAKKVTGIICQSTKSIYKSIVQENSYRSYIRALLIMFMAFLGVGFLIGVLNMTHNELLVIILKMAIVLQVSTSTTSWEFFNENFFSFFTNGVGEITGILFGQGAQSGPGANIGLGEAGDCAANIAGIQAFDEALDKLFSYDTTRKILSLMVWKIYGFLFVAALYIAIVIIVYAMIKAILFFFMSYLALSIIIVLAPIFIPFMLFKLTKAFFDNWLKQLISYFIQPIIVLTFAFFMITLLMNQLQYLIGYRVCWKEWFEIPVIDIKFYAWQSDYSKHMKGCIPTPNAIMKEDVEGTYKIVDAPGPNSCGSGGSLKYSGMCDPYMCYEQRYLGFPYLDPTDEIDANRINELQQNHLISFTDIIVLFMMLWFVVKFNSLVPAIAKRLAGTPGSQADMAEAAGGMAKGLGKVGLKVAETAINPLYKKMRGGKTIREDITSIKKKVLGVKDGEKETKKKNLQEERDQLMEEMRADATNTKVSLESKANKAKRIRQLDDKIEDLQKAIDAGADGSDMSRSFFARSSKAGKALVGGAENVANAPGDLVGKAAKTVAKAPADAVIKPTKYLAKKTLGKPYNAIKDKVMKRVTRKPIDKP
ncbi:MAG: type IV secretion system protein [Alphaproteobacteria bacterium]|nr:type IV secretion system protein [Alphaproteobacteria bacterium]